jgi:hypothetical protein
MEEIEQASVSKHVKFSRNISSDGDEDTSPLLRKETTKNNYSSINNGADEETLDGCNFLNLEDVNEHIFAHSHNFSEGLETDTDEVINNNVEVKIKTSSTKS